MTRIEALDLIGEREPLAKRRLSQLMLWNPHKRLSTNAKRLGISQPMATQIAKRYDLRFFRGRYGSSQATLNKVNAIRRYRKRGWTYKEIGMHFRLSKQRVQQLLAHYKNT